MAQARFRFGAAGRLAVVLLVGPAAWSAGCGTVQVPMTPAVAKIEAASPLPVEAALLVSQETRDRRFTGTPEGYVGDTRAHEFPLGAALESASRQAFEQVFQKLTVVRTREEAQPFRLVIEPTVAGLRFGYEERGFTVTAVATASVRVAVATPTSTVWVKTVESPKQRSGAWVMKLRTEKEAGEAASAALAAALERAAMEIASHPAVLQALGREPGRGEASKR